MEVVNVCLKLEKIIGRFWNPKWLTFRVPKKGIILSLCQHAILSYKYHASEYAWSQCVRVWRVEKSQRHKWSVSVWWLLCWGKCMIHKPFLVSVNNLLWTLWGNRTEIIFSDPRSEYELECWRLIIHICKQWQAMSIRQQTRSNSSLSLACAHIHYVENIFSIGSVLFYSPKLALMTYSRYS